MKTRFTIGLIALLLVQLDLKAQNSTDTGNSLSKNETSYLKADVNFISDAVFMGRKDSISAPYLYPSITYHHKSGFYTTGSFSFLTRSNESRIDLYLISAGFDFTSNKFSGDISATKYVFSDDSYNVISEITADITAAIRYDFDVVNLGLVASSYFNTDSNSDVFLSSEISHDFVSTNGKFQFTPTAGIYLGSQNFYQEYFINSRFSKGHGSGNNSDNNTQETTNVRIDESQNFGVMAIELSLPMWYSQKSFTALFVPNLVLPQNEATLIIDDLLVKEDLENTFYWMLGLSYKF